MRVQLRQSGTLHNSFLANSSFTNYYKSYSNHFKNFLLIDWLIELIIAEFKLRVRAHRVSKTRDYIFDGNMNTNYPITIIFDRLHLLLSL